MPILPALRLTAESKGCVMEEGVSLDSSLDNGLKVAPSVAEHGQSSTAASKTKENGVKGLNLTTDPEDSRELQDAATDGEGSPLPTGNPTFATNSVSERRGPLHFSRTLSMPLPSQLSQLQNPHRPTPLDPRHSDSQNLSVRPSRVDEVAVELADSIQLVIQTMLHISPPQVLDPAKEQFSACALSVPTPSMSAMFTAMKNINYISAHMPSFCDTSQSEELPTNCDTRHHNEFDFGELLQCLGDALSGAAAQSGVDLVIYHAEVGVKQVYVSGDESGISFVLSHVRTSCLGKPCA